MADDLCFSRSSSFYNLKNNPNFQFIQCIILHDLIHLCSFIISYPLYFSYFIFFSPYLMRFFSFISPLFIATTLLSLLLTTTTAFCPKLPPSELGILQAVLKELKSNLDIVRGDEEEWNFEDFEIYRIVFGGASLITIGNEDHDQFEEEPKEVSLIGNEDDDQFEEEPKEVSLTETIPENSVHGGRRNDITTSHFSTGKTQEANNLEKLFEELDRFEDFTPAIETSADSYKVVGELRKEEPDPVKKVGSESKAVAMAVAVHSSDNNKIIQNSGRDGVAKVDKSSSWRLNSSSSLHSHGSMRDEKEWRRTLACKLFEERHNSGGEEGMDSLWEAYENDNAKNRKETIIKKNKKNMMMTMKNNNNGGIKCFDDDDHDEEEEEEEEEEMSNGHLCCLQALKFSTGKMNLGMGKPNLVKISKALKGFGWLHHVGSKHGKKR